MPNVHASYYRPRIFPIKGSAGPAEIDRAQSIDPGVSLNWDKVEEIGRDGTVGYNKKSPNVTYALTQIENGSIEFFQKLVNSTTKGASGQSPITLNDFKTPYFDICAYLTDSDNTFKGTVHYPGLRTAGFALNVGDPQASMERTFNFVGESALVWKEGNKYLIYIEHTAGSGNDDEIDLSAKVPVEDPNLAGVYMYRVVRVTSGGATTVLTTADYTYVPATKILTINSITTGDLIKVWHTSATAPDTIFTPNDSDPASISGESVDIYLYVPASGKPSTSDYIYKLQSIAVDVSFDREDLREVGNKEVTSRGITNSTVNVTLGSRVDGGFTIEEVLSGVAPGYGKIDVSEFSDQITLIVKIYEDNTKTSFKYGWKASGLSSTDSKFGANVNEYVSKDASLTGESLVITADATELGI